ncbi:MAG TPA: recombination protein RecR, partial [Candidatus Paceibacterota bacterium]|nr:recombination protein RecR [Candidatus Paceibacterota bacterium]
MADRVEDLARAFERFPGIGPRQARRFVYHLLGVSSSDRARMADLIAQLAADVRQCTECMRFGNGGNTVCKYCS